MPVLLIAAHGTRSPAGLATTRELADAVRAARPSARVELCFLDVLAPSLEDALDELTGHQVVVVPLLLSPGYHVTTDIPRVVAGRRSVLVAGHLGPDPLVLEAVTQRLAEACTDPATVFLAAVGSSQGSAQREVQTAASRLGARLGRHLQLLALDGDLRAALSERPAPVAVATYLLAEGVFLDRLRAAADGLAAVAEPIGPHPALVELVLTRYDEALSAS